MAKIQSNVDRIAMDEKFEAAVLAYIHTPKDSPLADGDTDRVSRVSHRRTMKYLTEKLSTNMWKKECDAVRKGLMESNIADPSLRQNAKHGQILFAHPCMAQLYHTCWKKYVRKDTSWPAVLNKTGAKATAKPSEKTQMVMVSECESYYSNYKKPTEEEDESDDNGPSTTDEDE